MSDKLNDLSETFWEKTQRIMELEEELQKLREELEQMKIEIKGLVPENVKQIIREDYKR